MVGGNPNAGEIFGFIHRNEKKKQNFIALRNPAPAITEYKPECTSYTHLLQIYPVFRRIAQGEKIVFGPHEVKLIVDSDKKWELPEEKSFMICRNSLYLPNNERPGVKEIYRPLAAYKMLIDLGEADSDGAWRCFCAAAPETVKWIADTLKPLEPNMTKDLLAVKARFGNDPAKVRGFVLHNLKYLRARAMQYTVRSIDSFVENAAK